MSVLCQDWWMGRCGGGAAQGSSPNASLEAVKPWPLTSAGPGWGKAGWSSSPRKSSSWLDPPACCSNSPSTTAPTAFLHSLLLPPRALLGEEPGDPQPVIWPWQSPCISDPSGPGPWPGSVWASRARLCPGNQGLLPFYPFSQRSLNAPSHGGGGGVFPPPDPKSARRRGSDNSPRGINGLMGLGLTRRKGICLFSQGSSSYTKGMGL